MKIIYTSTLGCPKDDGKKLFPEPFEKSFCDVLKKLILKADTLLFVSNRWPRRTSALAPKDEVFNDFHYTNKQYANAVLKSFSLSGIKFKKLVVVDKDYKGDIKKDVENADFIFVQGGHTPRGLKILKDLGFDALLRKYDKTICFTSTSAKLPATKVLSTHHGNMNEYEIEEGLGLKNYSVRPHFNITKKDLFNKKIRNRIKLIKSLSRLLPVLAFGNQTFAVDDNGELTIYGKAFLFKNAKKHLICKSGSKKKLVL